MPPSIKRKNSIKQAMCRAVRVVRNGDTGYLRASKYVSVPRGTLHRYVKDTSLSPEELLNVHVGRMFLPNELENKIVEYCITMDQRYFELRRQDIKRMAFRLAIRNGLKHPFNQEKSAAGKKWLRSLLKRHPVIRGSFQKFCTLYVFSLKINLF
jgi:hypothetical protein